MASRVSEDSKELDLQPIDGIVLAAGESTRFGGGQVKQLYEIDGEPMVRRVCRAAVRSSLREIIVVTGCAAEQVEAVLADLPVRIVFNTDYKTGQSSSVRTGLAALRESATGALFLPADQPWLDAGTIDLVAAETRRSREIVIPRAQGQRGAPVGFGRRYFGRLARLQGDEGARQLFQDLPTELHFVELASARALIDIDNQRQVKEHLSDS